MVFQFFPRRDRERQGEVEGQGQDRQHDPGLEEDHRSQKEGLHL